MPDAEFKEECRGWDVNDVVFSKQMWELYGGLLRADFGLFDTYVFEHAGAAPFDTRISTFFAESDKRITRKHVEGWRSFSSSAEFNISELKGHHLFVYDAEQKAAWFNTICVTLKQQLVELENQSLQGTGTDLVETAGFTNATQDETRSVIGMKRNDSWHQNLDLSGFGSKSDATSAGDGATQNEDEDTGGFGKPTPVSTEQSVEQQSLPSPDKDIGYGF
jgi:hypothetical protein